MKLTTRIVNLQLRHTFTIARDSKDVSPVVITEIEHDGIVGTGEACPNRYYNETPEAVAETLEGLSPWLAKKSPLAYEHFLDEAAERLGQHRGALSSLDLATFDWVGRKLGQPLYRLLGLDPRRSPKSSYTIGIDSIDQMVEKIHEVPDFRIIKIKLGTPRDIEIVRALRDETDAVFRVDANCAWSVEETLEKSKELAALGVEFIEQPLPADQLESMEEVYAKSTLPVIADENSVVPADVPRLSGKFHGINIKLVKCGGIRPALRMVHLARTLGMNIMLGCMVDSSVSATAATHIGALMDYLDLDGPLLITNDPYRGVEYVDAQPRPPDRPGLGVESRGAAPLSESA